MRTTMQLKRIVTGLSQDEFATQVGVSRQTISSVERRLSNPSVQLALTIARALDSTVEEIFGDTLTVETISTGGAENHLEGQAVRRR